MNQNKGMITVFYDGACPKCVKLIGNWMVVDEHHLEKEYIFSNFSQALAFTNQVGELAEAEGHHPDIYLAWGKEKLTPL